MIRKLAIFKSLALKHHMKLLTRSGQPTVAEKSLNEIIAIIAADDDIRRALEAHDANAGVIYELYHFLEQGGADRWVHGNYVAALSITNPVILRGYLRNRGRRHERLFRLAFADTCIRYVEGGYTEAFLKKNLEAMPQAGVVA